MPGKSLLKAKRDIRKRRLASAEEHLRQALAGLQALPAQAERESRAECVGIACELARSQARGREMAEAERLLGFALEIARAGNAVEQSVEIYRLRALLAAHLCRFSDAEADCERALSLIRGAGLEDHLSTGIQDSLGLIQRARDDQVAALKLPPVYVDSLTWETRFLHNDLSLPKTLADVTATVSDLRVLYSDPFTWEMELSVRYEAEVPLTEGYRGEEWKRVQTKFLGRDPIELPMLILGLGAEEEVVAVEVHDAQGELVSSSADTRAWTIFLPDSYPRLGDLPLAELVGGENGDALPLCKRFRYFLGKAVVVSWAAATGESHRIRARVEAYRKEVELARKQALGHRVSLMVPTGKVHLGQVQTLPEGLDAEGTCTEIWGPFEGRNIREADETILHQLLQTATPEVSSENAPERLPLSGERRLRDTEGEAPKQLENFCLLVLSCTLRLADPIAVAARPVRSPLPVGVYPHLRMLQGWKGFGVLCYQLGNFGGEPEKLRLTTEILGQSHPQVEEIVLGPGAILPVRHAPELLPGSLANGPVMVRWEVMRLRDEAILGAGSAPLAILDRSRLPRILVSPEDGRRRDLTPFVAAYVMPQTRAIQQLVVEAATSLPDVSSPKLEGYSSDGTPDERSRAVHTQVETLFRHLKEVRRIRCMGEEIVWGTGRGWEEQSLRLPGEILEAGGGNCLDLSLLMASCLEHLGIRAWICLTPGHAFVGFEPLEDRDEVAFLETAFLDQETPGNYREAVEEGERLLRTEFDRGSPGRNWCRGISVTEARARWQIGPWEEG
ncbi:MAG: tetratricopeptide repeat protein [Candidatus Methylomirabilales bacterium]